MPGTATFRGPLEFCSNFYWPCPIIVDGKRFVSLLQAYQAAKVTEPEVYDSVEHAYQAFKFLDPKLREKFRGKGKDALTPAEAKRLARTLKAQGLQRKDWEQVNLAVMEDLVRQKFQEPKLRKLLLATDPKTLVEGNYWHDNFWGDCSCAKCADKPKLNHLGRILMKIREEIKRDLS
jgi:hypothetical protein